MQVARHFVAARVPRADVSNPVVAYAHPMPSGDGVAMYAVNVAGCFVMVAADDVAHPVLGYSLSRPWPVADKEGGKQQKEDKAHRSYPPHIVSFLDDLAAQIGAAKAQSALPDGSTALEWQQLEGPVPQYSASNLPDSVGPLLTTTWDQGQYYNALCPEDPDGPNGHALTGCVATAMAQIINYWGYPVHGRGSHSIVTQYGIYSADYDRANYDYANMVNSLTASSTSEQVNAVAKLMYDCGVAVNMRYGAHESGALDHDLRAALTNHFKYLPSSNYANKVLMTDTDWNKIVKANIRAGHPLLYPKFVIRDYHMRYGRPKWSSAPHIPCIDFRVLRDLAR